MRRVLHVVLLSLACTPACIISMAPPPTAACESDPCGCWEKKPMTFTGVVADGDTGECIPFKLVRLRDRDGTVKAEDRSKSFGSYTVSGEVDRSPKGCPGGEPVIRDDPEAGQELPTYTYLPRRTPVDDFSERVDLFRFPWGTVDAGPNLPTSCTPPRTDGGAGDAG
ncbi:MAG: hypothetical protein AB2A00_00640 [Myxococcota bacterium]